MSKHTEDIPCAILCGGNGSRMGGEKCFVDLAGKPMIEHVLAAAKSVFPSILISCKDPAPFAHLHLPTVVDRFTLQSPLVGIHSVLSRTRSKRVCFLAVDMPLVQPELLRLLRDFAPGADIVVPKIGNFFEPLLAVYSKRCARAIHKQLDTQNLRVRSFFENPGLDARILTREQITPVDPRLVSFLNANTRDRLKRIESQLYEYSENASNPMHATE